MLAMTPLQMMTKLIKTGEVSLPNFAEILKEQKPKISKSNLHEQLKLRAELNEEKREQNNIKLRIYMASKIQQHV